MRIDREVYRYIEHEMYHYREYKKELMEYEEEVLEGSPEPPDGMPKGNGTSNPTENKALKLVTPKGYREMEKTISSIDTALNLLSERHKKIFEMVYLRKRRDYYGISDDLHISFRTFQYAKKELILTVGRELGAIKKFA